MVIVVVFLHLSLVSCLIDSMSQWRHPDFTICVCCSIQLSRGFKAWSFRKLIWQEWNDVYQHEWLDPMIHIWFFFFVRFNRVIVAQLLKWWIPLHRSLWFYWVSEQEIENPLVKSHTPKLHCVQSAKIFHDFIKKIIWCNYIVNKRNQTTQKT